MTISEALPLNAETQNDQEELIRLQADFGAGGEFGHRELVVTRTFVRVLEPGGALAFQMPLAEIQTARNEPLVGGGRLEITAKNGDILPVVTYSQTVAAQFSEAARGIEQLAKGRAVFHQSESGADALRQLQAACCPKKTASARPASTAPKPCGVSPPT